MAAPRLFRPAARLLSSRLASSSLRPALPQSACAHSILRSRGYATEGGVKEVTVRDALNEALAEELESNQKTFILGEEVAQYNGAYV
jgi:pyruvate dehydrogenase E1 component beta subunit